MISLSIGVVAIALILSILKLLYDKDAVDLYGTYHNIARENENIKFTEAVRVDKNYLIQNSIKEYIDTKISEDKNIIINYTVNNDKYTLDLEENVIFESVDVALAGERYNWNFNNFSDIYTTDFIDYDTNTEALDINVNSHVEYEELLDKQLDIVNKYIFNYKRPEFKFENGALVVTKDSEKGQNVDIEKFKAEFISLVESKESGDITVVTTETPSDISEDEIEAVNTKLSQFTTYFSPSYSRGGNIRVATERVNGTLVAPGEEISVDKLFLSRNAANGYYKAGSYLNGKTVQTYGGGICQVSSTLYGAVIRAGLIPTQRFAHSMSVSYVPLGLDAAISEGYKDLKIKNTYNHPIYIQGIANSGSVTFRIYGREDLLDGYTYKPVSTSGKGGLYANSWLHKIKDGEVVEKIHLFESSYRPHS